MNRLALASRAFHAHRVSAWNLMAALVFVLPSVTAAEQSSDDNRQFRPWEPPRQVWHSPNTRSPGAQPMPQAYQPGGWPGYQPPGYARSPYAAPAVVQPRLTLAVYDTNPVVQQNLVLNLLVTSGIEMASVTPSFPRTDSAVFQPVKGPITTTRQIGNSREILYEFIYQLTPLEEGRLVIDGISVEGKSAAGRYPQQMQSQRYEIKASQPLTLDVQPAPSTQKRLPLESLLLTSHWNDDTPTSAGHPVTLTVEIRASGASGKQLPSVETQLQNPDYRIYRESSRTHTELSRDGRHILGRRIENYTLVPQAGGDLSIPRLQIPWWNVVRKRDELAYEPGRMLAVHGSPAQPEQSRTESNGADSAITSSTTFWIVSSVAYGIMMGYWFAAFRMNPKKSKRLRRALAPATQMLRRQLVGVAPAFAPLRLKLQDAATCLNPVTRWQRVRQWIVNKLPRSVRFWFCIRCAQNESDPDAWGYTLRALANRHLDMPPKAPFKALADHITHSMPGTDPNRIRTLVSQLDNRLYGRKEIDFVAWKQDFRQAIKPRLTQWPIRINPRWRRRTETTLPALNPEFENA